jgi:hypothetical protein
LCGLGAPEFVSFGFGAEYQQVAQVRPPTTHFGLKPREGSNNVGRFGDGMTMVFGGHTENLTLRCDNACVV